jgi:hypothetical protein
MKIYPTTSGLAVSETSPGPYDAVRFVLSLPPGSGVIVELRHDGPYRRGIFRNESNPRKSTGVICPYCEAEVLVNEYPEFGFYVFICRCLGFFTRLLADSFSRDDWAHLVRQPARIWAEAEAAEKGGPHSEEN